MPANKTDVAAAYDRWAESYDTDPNQTRELAASVLRRQNLNLTGRTIVEIGCGTGRNTEWLVDHAAAVIGVDFSAEMLNVAKSRVRSSRVRFIQHDLSASWPVADASADLVLDMLVLEHIEDLQPIYAEAARVLRPGGALFICELHPFRQMSGRRAEFLNKETGEVEQVAAWVHQVSDFVKTGLTSGFELIDLDDWFDSDARPGDLPRLLSVHFRLSTLPVFDI
jgi:malonyl-CoA O-methyltransferase